MLRMSTSKIVLNFLVVVAIMTALNGCSNRDDQSNVNETLYGRYLVREMTNVIGPEKNDSVMVVVEGSSYRISHFDSPVVCPSYGSIEGFGGSAVTLTPIAFEGSQCDSLRIPHGVFSAEYPGDSIILRTTQAITVVSGVTGLKTTTNYELTIQLTR